MGTTLTDDERIQQLRELLEEYVKYLDLWEKVEVTKIVRTKGTIPMTVRITDAYGIESDVIQHKEVKIPPSIYVVMKYYSPKGKWKDILHPTGHETREFPMCDIVRRINHYKNRLKNLKEKTS
jgi:DNA-binding cell septation regulator SpoVG